MHRVGFRGLGLLLLLVALLGLATPAHAHDYLVSSTPESGATLSPAPDEVSLVFNTSIGQEFAQVAVVGPDGSSYQDGAPVVDGTTVTQAVGDLPDGGLTISYRIVSSDGHPIGGTIPFQVASTPDQAATGETGGNTDPQPADVPADEGSENAEAPTAPDDAKTQTAAATEDASGSGALVWVIGLVAVSVVGALGVGLARRRSRSTTHA